MDSFSLVSFEGLETVKSTMVVSAIACQHSDDWAVIDPCFTAETKGFPTNPPSLIFPSILSLLPQFYETSSLPASSYSAFMGDL